MCQVIGARNSHACTKYAIKCPHGGQGFIFKMKGVHFIFIFSKLMEIMLFFTSEIRGNILNKTYVLQGIIKLEYFSIFACLNGQLFRWN